MYPMGFFNSETMQSLKDLEIRKNKFLEFEESTWRLKSRAVWLAKGYRNTIFFHKFMVD